MSAYPNNGSGALMHGEFMAFIGDEESLSTVRGWADRQGFPAASVQSGGPDLFSQMLEHASAPKFSIVDLDGQSDPAGIIARLVRQCGAECKVIALGSANDVSLYRAMLAAGAADYLVKPLTIESLAQSFALALRGGAQPGQPEAKEAKIVVVIGVRGGVGASLIVVNTGWLLAHEFKRSCALLDLDLQFGTSSLALDLEPGHGLRDVVGSPQRVDSLMVASSMVAASDRFSILSAEESVDEVIPMDSSAVIALLKELRHDFDFVIVDLPRHLIAAQKRLLAAAHEIILVSELSLAGIRDTLRIKNALIALGAAAHLTLITTRAGAGRPSQIDTASFEKGAQIKIGHIVPEDPKAVAEASNIGKPLGETAPQAAITKSLIDLAGKLGGKGPETQQEKKAGWWEKLAGGGKTKAKGGG